MKGWWKQLGRARCCCSSILNKLLKLALSTRWVKRFTAFLLPNWWKSFKKKWWNMVKEKNTASVSANIASVIWYEVSRIEHFCINMNFHKKILWKSCCHICWEPLVHHYNAVLFKKKWQLLPIRYFTSIYCDFDNISALIWWIMLWLKSHTNLISLIAHSFL